MPLLIGSCCDQGKLIGHLAVRVRSYVRIDISF
jgi:hypothetical protein